MSTTADLVTALKKELKTAQMTYADLAQALGMAESSVKRMLAKGDMPLSRIDAICRALALDFAALAGHEVHRAGHDLAARGVLLLAGGFHLTIFKLTKFII